jgi:hypothetical protein
LVSWFDATSSTAMPGSTRCRAARIGGSSQQAATMLVVMRTLPPVASRVLASARPSDAAPSSICRAASAIASAATVGTTPRPVRSKRGTPSCDSSSATWRDSVGC